MLKNAYCFSIVFVLILSLINISTADLIDRGNGLIYDTDLDITWLQDANYAKTSGYDSDGDIYPAIENSIIVPSSTFPTIQSAIDAAADGYIIIVEDGTYRGPGNTNIDFKGKAILLRSRHGPENCIIDCERNDRAMNFPAANRGVSKLKQRQLLILSAYGALLTNGTDEAATRLADVIGWRGCGAE